ncbi:MAG: PadR family transcriptional regulator [Pseudomonadota bacterium]
MSILSDSDSYGYDIIQAVRDRSAGELNWADGMLYPILHRLEKKGLIESYWGQAPDTGRRRKYYRLKKLGATELKTQRDLWQRLNTMIQQPILQS